MLYGHSVGGLITSGLGFAQDPATVAYALQIWAQLPDPETMLCEKDVKDELMLRPALGLCAPDALELTERLNTRYPVAEARALMVGWPRYWREYCAEVRVPALNGVGDEDGAFGHSRSLVEEFGEGFEKSRGVRGEFLYRTPHAVELSRMGRAWYLGALGFACLCAGGWEKEGGVSPGSPEDGGMEGGNGKVDGV